MDAKTLQILEFDKIREKLASYCAFPASAEKARSLLPTSDLFEAQELQAETSEAVGLLVTRPDLTIGGVRDVREAVDLANHGGVLPPNELLDIKFTLVAARTLARTFERLAPAYPRLADIVAQIPPPLGIIDAVTRAISERGEILDSASDKLGNIRRELRIVHDRLMTKLQKMVGDPKTAPYMQEALVTQRDGRYVLPLRAEFKGRVRGIIHDQSASGATLFIEPLGVVEQNNQYRELQLAERDEERRILAELSQQVGQHAFEINHTVEVIAVLDLVLARAKYAEDLRASEPVLHPIGGMQSIPGKSRKKTEGAPALNPNAVIRLYEARHPLLEPESVVPVDLELDPHTFALVITGPNTGGKTVTLKTAGLLALMAQSGLHIPAHSGSEISVFQQVFADIGDEQSIEQSLSTFSGHITNIIQILEKANQGSLVILDELGAGTDPQEGAALARAILTDLVSRGIMTLVTTHHPELKAFAHATPGVTNASVEFDLETLRPTYRLTIGLPGRSNAVAIAERLGIPKPIIERARSEINPDELRADDLLNEIYNQRDLARQARAEGESSRQEAERLRAELAAKLDNIEDERRKLLEEARQESEGQYIALQQEIAEARRALMRARQPLDVLQAIEEGLAPIAEQVAQPVERLAPDDYITLKSGGRLKRAIRLGDKVRLRSLGTVGIVTALAEEEVELQIGVLRVRTRLSEVEHPPEESPAEAQKVGAPSKRKSAPPPEPQPTPAGEFLPASPGIELDLRGRRSDEALEEMERYLDAAFVSGLPFVRIIHGKGTGKLREVVRQALQAHPHIRSFETGGEKEGGEGVTVIKLAQTV